MGNSFGCSASGERLVSAARDGDLIEAKMLLEFNPGLAKYSTFGGLNSPLHFAASKGYESRLSQWKDSSSLCIRLVVAEFVASVPYETLHARIDADIGDGFNTKRKQEQSALCKFINKTADAGITALHMAAFNGYIDCVQLLPDLNAYVSASTYHYRGGKQSIALCCLWWKFKMLSNPPCKRRLSDGFELQQHRKMEPNGATTDMGLIGENFDSGLMNRAREDEFDSRSGSENFDASGDENEAGDDQHPNKRKKKYHRHTPQQIQELENFFKECPHPDEKQRADLSRKLGLDNKQVKFWFQNKRTQMKTQLERHENMILRQENEKLRAENSVMKEALANPICSNCGGPAIPGQISMDDHQLRIENARMKEELARVSTLNNKLLGRPVSALTAMSMQNPNFGLDFGMGRNGMVGPSNYNMQLPMGFVMGDGVMGNQPANSGMQPPMGVNGTDAQQERSMLIDLALAAMNELIKMSEPDSLIWMKSPETGKDVLNHEEYARIGSPFNCTKPNNFVAEATRETGLLYTNSAALVETFMDADRWSEMFPCMIAQATTLDVLSNGMGGTRNGSMQLMHAEVQLPSPFVPVRQYTFLRYSKQHGEGVWVVADVSVDIGRNAPNGNPYMSSKKLPSGCILQDTSTGMCKITWVDHSVYDESAVHQIFRPMVNSGLAFGAHRWVATLQRHCESLAILMSAAPSDDPTVISPSGKRSMSKLAQRMSDYFWSGVCPSSACKWDTDHFNNLGNSDIRIMSRKIPDATGENVSIVLSAATSVWMPVSRQRVFDFLRDAQLRGEWDLLSSGGTMQEMVHIGTGEGLGNSVSIIRSDNTTNGSEGLYLQDSWTDSSGSMVVYSPINMQSLHLVMTGGDSSFVALLPSGFSILPDGHSSNNNIMGSSSDGSSSSGSNNDNGGCFLTVGLQMLLNNHPSSKLTTESVDTINDHIATTIQKVKDALGVA